MENPNAGLLGNEPGRGLWLQPDGTMKPYWHVIDDKCDCKTCESKIRRIILPYAA
jgi:hypothetical protein